LCSHCSRLISLAINPNRERKSTNGRYSRARHATAEHEGRNRRYVNVRMTPMRMDYVRRQAARIRHFVRRAARGFARVTRYAETRAIAG
jgi:hypothetical protein